MSDQLNYDPFEVGDKVWCEMYGFGELLSYYKNDCTAFFAAVFKQLTYHKDSEQIVIISSIGNVWGNTHRPRTIFHAVADTDEGMREAIARGHGLRRTVPRGRFEIKPGDTVFSIIEGRPFVCISSCDETTFPLAVGFDFFKENGQGYTTKNFPMWIRLYDGEEPPKTVAERLRFFADEMEKDGWEEKYGGGK